MAGSAGLAIPVEPTSSGHFGTHGPNDLRDDQRLRNAVDIVKIGFRRISFPSNGRFWIMLGNFLPQQDSQLPQVLNMAKKKVNKSQAIRDYVSAYPKASAKQVVAALAKKRIKVTPATVATVKSKAGLTKRGTNKWSSRRPKVRHNNNFVEILIEAKKFTQKAGSTEVALEAIKALERIDAI